MKEIIIIKRCKYIPPGSERKVDRAPSSLPVLVDDDQAKAMVEGCVAIYVDDPVISAKSNKKKEVKKTK